MWRRDNRTALILKEQLQNKSDLLLLSLFTKEEQQDMHLLPESLKKGTLELKIYYKTSTIFLFHGCGWGRLFKGELIWKFEVEEGRFFQEMQYLNHMSN